MQLLSRTLPKDHNIILAGDQHEGTIAHHRKGWAKVIKRVQDEENTYIAIGGDLIEAICVDDKRYSIETVKSSPFDGGSTNAMIKNIQRITPLDQMNYMQFDLHSIRDKILFVLTGNHELKVARYGNLTENMCATIGVPYGGWSTKLHIFTQTGNKKQSCYKLFYTHGNLSVKSACDDPIRRRANMELQVKRKLYQLTGDACIQATAHCHQLIVVPPMHELYMTDKNGKIRANYTSFVQRGEFIPPNLRYYVATGSFLKTFVEDGITTYSERAMYPPADLGYAEIIVRGGIVETVKENFIGIA